MDNYFKSGDIVGLVGVGKLGSKLRDEALTAGCEVILCDPPRAFAEADELSESFFDLWGNGMGGCQLTNVGMETFVPLEKIARATVISIQVPLTRDGKYPTFGMITAEFLASCRPDVRILCWSSPEVVSPEAIGDKRLVFMGEEEKGLLQNCSQAL
ncbi:MAG: hypothetical protein IJT83_08820 [Victivallales bacterium]|nr:hypothetical protein [Victivallales bacterium]